MATILVTGATGFIGRPAAAALAAQGHRVLGLSRRAVDLPVGVQPLAADLLDPAAVEATLAAARPTHLLHLAWDVTPGRFWTSPTNLDWTAASLTLLRAFAAAGGTRAVFAGSCAEHRWDCPVLAEDAPIGPGTLYGICKDALRRAAAAGAETLGVSFAWGRTFWLYGPREAPRRLVSDIAAALIDGRPADCTSGRQRRDFLHVDDVAGAYVAALLSDHQGAFNIGSGEPIAVAELATRLARLLDREELLRLGARPDPVGDPETVVADSRVLRDRIGWRPRYSLDAGLEQTARWWLDAARRQSA